MELLDGATIDDVHLVDGQRGRAGSQQVEQSHAVKAGAAAAVVGLVV